MMIKKKIKEVISSMDINSNLKLYFNNFTSETSSNNLSYYITALLSRYARAEYHFIPMYFDDFYSDDLYVLLAIEKLENYLDGYSHIFSDIDDQFLKLSVDKNYTNTGSDNRNVNITDTKTGSNSSIKTNTGVDVDTTSGSSNGMGENSPINADINSINTPNVKSKNSFNSQITKEKDTRVTNTDTIDESVTKSGTDAYTRNSNIASPENYKIFMGILEDYNVSKILNLCVRKIIAEFNSSL